ncbi:iron-sulfur cluster repair di-iron protein [Flavobacterium filum]|uniref:iron-sulfur cluster repair di-iron protein n=1 Tax=Flavobacterium filum TaxID=370974 RepID=UPI0023F12B63|nr:iron-sulfur cluster repair di-iron protein [Flavobacterium filum]
MNIQENQIIGELVAQDYRTAAVFKSFGIDFCCKGNRTINEVCESRNIEPLLLIENLEQVIINQENQITDYQSWPIDLMADFIEKKHHRYVIEKTLEIKPYLNKICKVHGDCHPELFEINEHFNSTTEELAQHMKKEELIIFPYVRKMMKAKQENLKLTAPHFGTIQNPIQMMMDEHTNEGDRFRKIEKLSNNYMPPQDACNTYSVTFALLKEFEQDLHLHIHLENNILFPKAIELEKQLNKT